jgi:hypothetical protein
MIIRVAAALTGACLVAALIAAPDADACSCASVKIRQALRQNDAAVIGKLRDVRPIGGAASERAGNDAVAPGQRNFIYRIRRVYKGERRIEVGTRIAVRSWGSEASCGLPRRPTRIGVFLNRKRRHWTSNLCWTVPAQRMRRAGERRGGGAGGGLNSRPARGAPTNAPAVLPGCWRFLLAYRE